MATETAAAPDFFGQLHGLDASTLRRIAAAALGRTSAGALEVADWHVAPLRGGASGSSVFRVSGTAHDAQGQGEALSAIVKCRAPKPGAPPGDRTWCREANAYRAGLVPAGTSGGTSAGLQGARCLAIDERPDGATWLWIEDLAALSFAGDGEWTLERHALAARHLGAFNARPLATGSVPAYPWLCRNLLGDWVEGLLAMHTLAAIPDSAWRHPLGFATVVGDLVETLLPRPDVWTHPRIRAAYSRPIAERALRLWQARGALMAGLGRLPCTLIHGDAHPRNVISRTGTDGVEHTVAIDWENVALGPLGEDAGRYLAVAALISPPGRAAALAGAIADGYLAGLEDAGLALTDDRARAARFATYVNAAFVMGFWAAALPPAALAGEPWSAPLRAGVEALIGVPVDLVVESWAEAAYLLLDLGEQALDWLPSL